MQIKSIEDLHREKAAGLARLYPPITKILVGMATCGLAAERKRIFDLLKHKAHASTGTGRWRRPVHRLLLQGTVGGYRHAGKAPIDL